MNITALQLAKALLRGFKFTVSLLEKLLRGEEV